MKIDSKNQRIFNNFAALNNQLFPNQYTHVFLFLGGKTA